jgi:hypothetical protein
MEANDVDLKGEGLEPTFFKTKSQLQYQALWK